MKLKILTLSFLILLVLPTLVDAYGIGVTPSSTVECVVPGQFKNVTFTVSGTNDMIDGYFIVGIGNLSWAYPEQYVRAYAGGGSTDFNVSIYTPKDIDYGRRVGNMLICTPENQIEGVPIQPCVEATLVVDVSETCPEIEAKKEFCKNLIKDILLMGLFVTVLIILARRVHKTKFAKKKQVRRTKKARKVKRRKK